MKDTIQILVTFDRNCIQPFQTMLYSLVANNTDESFHIWLLHSGLTDEELQLLQNYSEGLGAGFAAISINKAYFSEAPVMKQYPQEMYYRLLAFQFLPDYVNRIIYLDSDILIINPLRSLWEIDLDGNVFAAASHSYGLDHAEYGGK